VDDGEHAERVRLGRLPHPLRTGASHVHRRTWFAALHSRDPRGLPGRGRAPRRLPRCADALGHRRRAASPGSAARWRVVAGWLAHPRTRVALGPAGAPVMRSSRLALVLGAAAGAVVTLQPISDSDLFWHIANGRLTLQLALPQIDTFSWTIAG